jgi:hypothetical protein
VIAALATSYLTELAVEESIEVLGVAYGITMEVYENPTSGFEDFYCGFSFGARNRSFCE